MTLRNCNQDKWPQADRIVTTTLEGESLRGVRIDRGDVEVYHTGCTARLSQSIGCNAPACRGCDPLDDPASVERGTYFDDVSGEELPSDLAREARLEEAKFMQDWHVWDVRPISECRAVTGNAPIGGRGWATLF